MGNLSGAQRDTNQFTRDFQLVADSTALERANIIEEDSEIDEDEELGDVGQELQEQERQAKKLSY